MKLIIGDRKQGKTAELIKHSAETGNYILVHDNNRARIVAKQAKDMGFLYSVSSYGFWNL